ncbi:MAG: hypothetical protein AAB676_03535 [Verrucomicrobiota bacterium]
MRPKRPTVSSEQGIGEKGSVDSTVNRLKVTLRGSRPQISRRLEVRWDITLFQLHQNNERRKWS